MFRKNSDPLTESIQKVMKENTLRRKLEESLNEELGISSKKALPHEYHAAYDSVLSENIDKALNEKAPPGAKYERMVKHIKAEYGKDGLTDKEKAIAYATAWKAKNKKVDEQTKQETIGAGITHTPPPASTPKLTPKPAMNPTDQEREALSHKVRSINPPGPDGKAKPINEKTIKDILSKFKSKKTEKAENAKPDDHQGTYERAQGELDLKIPPKKKINEIVGEPGAWPGASRLVAFNEPKALPAPQGKAVATIPKAASRGIVPTIRNLASRVAPFAKSSAGPLSTIATIASTGIDAARQGVESGRVQTQFRDAEIGSKASIVGRALAKDNARTPGERNVNLNAKIPDVATPSPEALTRQNIAKTTSPERGFDRGSIQSQERAVPKASPAPAKPQYPDNDMADSTAGPREAPAPATQAPAAPAPATPAASPPSAPHARSEPKPFKSIRSGDKPAAPSWANDMGGGGALQNRSRAFGADTGA